MAPEVNAIDSCLELGVVRQEGAKRSAHVRVERAATHSLFSDPPGNHIIVEVRGLHDDRPAAVAFVDLYMGIGPVICPIRVEICIDRLAHGAAAPKAADE